MTVLIVSIFFLSAFHRLLWFWMALAVVFHFAVSGQQTCHIIRVTQCAIARSTVRSKLWCSVCLSEFGALWCFYFFSVGMLCLFVFFLLQVMGCCPAQWASYPILRCQTQNTPHVARHGPYHHGCTISCIIGSSGVRSLDKFAWNLRKQKGKRQKPPKKEKKYLEDPS